MTRTGKVTVVGAGFYGSTTAQRLAEYDIFDEVVLTDIIEGKPEGLALDMNQSRPVEGFETKVTGQTTGPAGEGYEVIAGSTIVIITAGLARKPGMSRMDLIGVNAKIVRSVTEQVVKHAPDAVLIVVSNPLDEMTALAAKVSEFPAHRVMGQAGMLDTARFSYFVAERLGVPVGSVRTLTLGSHGDTMVPVPSACSVEGKPLADMLPDAEIQGLVQRTRNGGAEIVGLLKTGSAYYAPSASAAWCSDASSASVRSRCTTRRTPVRPISASTPRYTPEMPYSPSTQAQTGSTVPASSATARAILAAAADGA
jgi:malate dehydrogenase